HTWNGDLQAFADAKFAVGLDPAAIVGEVDQGYTLFGTVSAVDNSIDRDVVAILASDPSMHAMHDFCTPTVLCDSQL
ncbi:MAG TPA: hypothetical protein VGQ34_06630, partial [Sphingomicrobium sp.]|nr:hypothetical protein [Sphingomicrobium sp.]